MTTAVMDPRSDTDRIVVFANGLLSSFGKPAVRKFTRKKDDGTDQTVHAYSGVPVFRSGTFSDSMGYEREWLPEQIDQMASNFTLLREGGYFPDPPVRKGHPGIFADTMDGLIGYITDLRTETRKSPLRDDEEEYRFLLADYEILDEEAQKKIDSTLWRNRSAEIGMYATNAPVKEIWPTFMGVAYVDISAVEGLNGFARQFGRQQGVSIQLEEYDMTAPTGKVTPQSVSAPTNGPVMSEFKIGAVSSNDHARVQEYISSLEGKNTDLQNANATFARQVAELTAFRDGAVAEKRETRITNLAKEIDGKKPVVTAPQLVGIRAFAAKLDDTQFDLYMKTMEERDPNPIFAVHTSGVTDQHAPKDPEDAEKARKDEAFRSNTEIVVALRQFGNMTQQQLEATDAFQALKAAGFTGTPKTLTLQ